MNFASLTTPSSRFAIDHNFKSRYLSEIFTISIKSTPVGLGLNRISLITTSRLSEGSGKAKVIGRNVGCNALSAQSNTSVVEIVYNVLERRVSVRESLNALNEPSRNS